MKRLRLTRPVNVPNAIERDGNVLAVGDADARLLLALTPPAAQLVEDLGADPAPQRPAQVRVVHACSVNGVPTAAGSIVSVSERDARALVALGRAEVVAGIVAAAHTEDGGAIVHEAAQNRGALVRPLGRRGGC